MNRLTSVALLVLSSFVTPALAGVFGFHTVVNPPFTTEIALTGHEGYFLSVGTDDGSTISAVDVKFGGKLHQRWEIDPDTAAVTPTPSSLATTNGDSHLLIPSDGLVALGPTENNNVLPSPLADTTTRDYGYGNSLFAAWGIRFVNQRTTLPIAYLVVPDGEVNNLDIFVQIATNPEPSAGGSYSLRGARAFGIVPEPATLTVAVVVLVGCGLRWHLGRTS